MENRRSLLDSFPKAQAVSPDFTGGLRAPLIRAHREAEPFLLHRSQIEIINLMHLVDERIDAHLEWAKDAGLDYRLGYNEQTASSILAECYLVPEKVIGEPDHEINIFELWAAFVLSQVYKAISLLRGEKSVKDYIEVFGDENTARYLLAGDATAEAIVGLSMLEKLEHNVPLHRENKKERAARIAQVKSFAAKKGEKAEKLSAARDKAYQLYDAIKKKNPKISASNAFIELEDELLKFIKSNKINLTYDNLEITFTKWIYTRKNKNFTPFYS